LDEVEALVALSHIPYLGNVKIKVLLTQFGSALNALNTDAKIIEELKGFGKKVSDGFKVWQEDKRWKETIRLSKKHGVKIIPYTSADYPEALLEIEDFPLLLYVFGDLKKEDGLSLAVVGTRNATIYGLEMAEKISGDLSSQGFTIVSGLARGIDTAAHKSALERGGRTLAIIGSGLGNIYPKENSKLAEAIAQNGAVITEFAFLTPPDRQNFPRRNRLVSGMTLGTVLVEAPEKSGAMITMNQAFAQRKKLFAVPGRGESFAGNHFLIKTHKAELVENSFDICKAFAGIISLNPLKSKEKALKPILSKEEQELLNQLPSMEFSIEEAISKSQASCNEIKCFINEFSIKKSN